MYLQDLHFSVGFPILVSKLKLERLEFYMNRIVLNCSTPSGHGGGLNLPFSDQSNHFWLPPHRATRRDLNRLLQKFLDIIVQQSSLCIYILLMILYVSISAGEHIIHVLWAR
jgi:hypothetical protein